MSHNPNRVAGNNGVRRVVRRYDPSLGHRRARGGGPQGIDLADLQKREATGRGWRVVAFKGDEFEVIYEMIAARNATGVIKHEEADRLVRVLRGQLYATMDGTIVTIRSGQFLELPKGTTYELSSEVADDVEVLFCQGAGYEEGVEVVRETDTSNPIPKTTPDPERKPVPKRKSAGKAMAAAEKAAAERKRRQEDRIIAQKSPPTTLVGQNEPGANLRPMGDPGDAV